MNKNELLHKAAENISTIINVYKNAGHTITIGEIYGALFKIFEPTIIINKETLMDQIAIYTYGGPERDKIEATVSEYMYFSFEKSSDPSLVDAYKKYAKNNLISKIEQKY